MTRRRAWTTGEDAELAAWSGGLDPAEMARRLGRTEAAVRVRLQRLGLTARFHRWRTEVCPECLNMRFGIRSGTCPVCARRLTLRRLEEEERRLETLLPIDVRASFDRDAERERVPTARPAPPAIPPGAARWEANEIRDRYFEAVQMWEFSELGRAVNAKRRRIGRLRRIYVDCVNGTK